MAKKTTAARPSADHRVLVLHGKDPYLRSLRTTELREALEAAGHDCDLLRFDGATARLADILDECRSFGLMAQHKIVLVDAADQLVKDPPDDAPRQTRPRDLLQRYAEHPAEDATLVLRTDIWRRGNLDKAISKVGAIIKCEAPNQAGAAKWAIARAAKRHDAALDPQAAAALVEQTGASLGRIDSELAKLAAATSEGQPITTRLVHELVGFTREETVWQIQDSVLAGDPERILAQLRDLLTVSRVPTVLARYALTDLARKLHGATAGRAAGVDPSELDSALKLWGPSKVAILAAARRLSPPQAADLLHTAVQTDADGKTGRGDEVRSLETLALRFASVLAH